ncbi:hypothetical protein Trydic_g16719 [Trypoxylus dichotomus]
MISPVGHKPLAVPDTYDQAPFFPVRWNNVVPEPLHTYYTDLVVPEYSFYMNLWNEPRTCVQLQSPLVDDDDGDIAQQ